MCGTGARAIGQRQAPQPLPECSPPRGGPCLPDQGQLRVPAALLQPLHPLRPGLGDAGPRGRPASEGARLAGRPPWASACSSTGGSGAPMSWRPCPAPWPSCSWGPWSDSPGAPPWTSSRTLGVGVGPPSREGWQEASTPGLPGHLPVTRACGLISMHMRLLITHSTAVWGSERLLRWGAELGDPRGIRGSSGQRWASDPSSARTLHLQAQGHVVGRVSGVFMFKDMCHFSHCPHCG